MKYTDIQYAYQRLVDTYVVHNKKVYRVINRIDNKLALLPWKGREILVGLEDLDLNPPPAGFINYNEDSCIFTTRKPMRRDWRQGFRPSNMLFKSYPRDGLIRNRDFRCTTKSLYQIGQIVQEKYPSISEALDKVEETHDAVAFSRNYAINENGQICYKYLDKQVGKIKSDKEIELNNNKFFLKEDLEELVSKDFHVSIGN